jgi:hypothetical protein
MRPTRVVAIIIGVILLVATGVAVAANFASNREVDFFAPGAHRFYVWCAGAHDYIATEKGANAEDAQMKLYGAVKAKGHSTCWPVWQGKIAG